MTGSKKGVIKHDWFKTYERRLVSCIATACYDVGYRGQGIVKKVNRLVPHWKSYFDGPIKDNALIQRADKSIRYDSEHPDIHPLKKPFWKLAQTIVKINEPNDKESIALLIKNRDKKSFVYKDVSEKTDVSNKIYDLPKIKALKTVKGYRYWVGEWAPTDDPNWHQFRKMESRETLEDIMEIFTVLCKTDMSNVAYGITVDPIY